MIYTNICKYAEKKKLSISDVEKKAGFTRGMIAKWKTHSPQIDNLKTVADILGVKVDALIKGD